MGRYRAKYQEICRSLQLVRYEHWLPGRQKVRGGVHSGGSTDDSTVRRLPGDELDWINFFNLGPVRLQKTKTLAQKSRTRNGVSFLQTSWRL